MRASKSTALSPSRYVLELLSAVLWSVVALCFLGCAHKPPAPEPAPPPATSAPVVVKLPPAEAPEAQPVSDADLEAILKGAVLQFDFDRAHLTAESMGRLGRIADALRAHPTARVKVAGHCDERGTQEYNLTLGQQRARAARDYLIALGVDGARIDTVSYGAELPADPGKSEQAWAKNRRDELTRVR